MQYKRFGKKFLIKLDKGDELVASIHSVMNKEGVKAGVVVSGIGGCSSVVIRYFDLKTKKYTDKEFKGFFEITSLSGNISVLDGKSFAHLHITLGDSDYNVFGGHLGSAIVEITCEIVINPFEGEILREFDPGTGANLIRM